MSRTLLQVTRNAVVRTRAAVAAVAISGLLATGLQAQAALGTVFIGKHTLTFQSSELTRAAGAELTTLFGVAYGRRYGQATDATRMTMVLRGTARPFEASNAGVFDGSAALGVNHDVRIVPGLSVAASAGAGAMAWGDDEARTGRLRLTFPVNAGAAYDIRVGRATIAPFAMATLARYDMRNYLDDVRTSSHKGWDGAYTIGTSLRLSEVVLTSSRIVGEYGMPNRSRWAFSAGISF